MKRIAWLLLGLVFAGCTQTYPSDRVKESIKEICRKEYGIERIDVKITGNTIGVYLPLPRLFATDFKEALLKGQTLTDIETALHPSPEALDQVEDVLFSISRVLLSTDLKLEFYVLQATDVEKTGLQLVLVGYVDDIKRVRLWDISRNEYRKRVLHEIRLNRPAVWHRPIRAFFDELEKGASLESIQKYFVRPLTRERLRSLFYVDLEAAGDKSARWSLGEVRSTALEPSRVLVHVPVELGYDAKMAGPEVFRVSSGTSLEYFMIVSVASEPARILRVIPLSYVDETGRIQKVPLPSEFQMQADSDSWKTEFPILQVQVGDFLAEQLTRRAQGILSEDERIRNTFEDVRMNFHYRRERPKKYFSLELEVRPKSPVPALTGPSALDEDVLYLLNLASREFVDVLRSYRFADYDFLKLNLSSDPISRMLAREELELFRQNKADLQGLLSGVSPF